MSKEIKKFISIDFGFKCLKLSEINFVDSSFVIDRLDILNFPQSVLADFSRNNIRQIVSELSVYLKRNKISQKNFVLSLPESEVYSRLISLPKLPEEKIADAVYWAMKPLIPVDLETVSVSFLDVNQEVKNGAEFENWFVVAAPKNMILDLQEEFKAFGLNLLAIETEAIASARGLKANYKITNDAILVDFGARSSSVILIRNANAAFAQSLEIGTMNLLSTLQSDFGISEIDSEKYTKGIGLNFESNNITVAQSLAKVVDQLLNEVNRIINYTKDKLNSNGITNVYLTGGGSKLYGIEKYIGSKLNIPTIKVNSVRAFKINPKTLKDVETNLVDLDFLVPIGLAIRDYI